MERNEKQTYLLQTCRRPKSERLLCPVSNPNIHAELDILAVHRECLGMGQGKGQGLGQSGFSFEEARMLPPCLPSKAPLIVEAKIG